MRLLRTQSVSLISLIQVSEFYKFHFSFFFKSFQEKAGWWGCLLYSQTQCWCSGLRLVAWLTWFIQWFRFHWWRVKERRDERQVCFPPRCAMEKLQKKWLIELHKLIESHGQQEAPSWSWWSFHQQMHCLLYYCIKCSSHMNCFKLMRNVVFSWPINFLSSPSVEWDLPPSSSGLAPREQRGSWRVYGHCLWSCLWSIKIMLSQSMCSVSIMRRPSPILLVPFTPLEILAHHYGSANLRNTLDSVCFLLLSDV